VEEAQNGYRLTFARLGQVGDTSCRCDGLNDYHFQDISTVSPRDIGAGAAQHAVNVLATLATLSGEDPEKRDSLISTATNKAGE
jgi:hypothetical protein